MLAEHLAVQAAAVVGRSAPVIGEIGVALVVLTGADPPTLQELRAFVSGQLAPDAVVVIDQFPLTPMLKADRAALRAWAFE